MSEAEPVFLQRFTEWKKARQHCPALKRAPQFDVCLYDGIPCSFVRCPRRIYERKMKEEGFVPIEDRISRIEKEVGNVKVMITRLEATINRLETIDVRAIAEAIVRGLQEDSSRAPKDPYDQEVERIAQSS